MSEFQSELDESCFLDSGSTKSLTVNEFKTSNSLKGLKLCSQNIRSVYKNLDALLLVLVSVSVVVDIFCLSETRTIYLIFLAIINYIALLKQISVVVLSLM